MYDASGIDAVTGFSLPPTALISPLYQTIHGFDQFLSAAQVRVHERKGSLLTLFFHGLLTADELARRAAYPQQGTTPEFFGGLVEYFLNAGYRFISPEELDAGTDPRGKYAMLTFDDGYFNNSRAVPMLERFQVPATIFVSALHVKEGRGFWWETLYHVRSREGRTDEEIGQELRVLNGLRTPEILDRIAPELGEEIFTWRGDADRPLSAAELREISRHPLVHIGNHTADHDILTSCSQKEAEETIGNAQDILKEISGKPPVSIAYPNGRVNDRVCEIARAQGLKIGFAANRRKEYLPYALSPERRMLLGRFPPLGSLAIQQQADYFRSDLMLVERLQSLKQRVFR
jgi:peptidoglycan/xylan/chitin deacetylase (PgdA/CDA1 family)